MPFFSSRSRSNNNTNTPITSDKAHAPRSKTKAMAAPEDKTLANLSGKWIQNKNLSDPAEPVLVIQGFSWATRTVVAVATVSIEVEQFTGPPDQQSYADPDSPKVEGPDCVHINLVQALTGGLGAQPENRCLDGVTRSHDHPMFGVGENTAKWATREELEKLDVDEYLLEDWEEGDEEQVGPNKEPLIYNTSSSTNNGWVATQVWGFAYVEGERHYVRRVVVTKGDERAAITQVWDWAGEIKK
ncbi:uncharacterized protein LOC62_03G004289 [Vanrija pseudolonga]|uniref:Lipocalin-like domain-containing protein n=1 Tax=Vanrija pseudolonga TaxID=143232 RepID=A0AAF0Y7E6_9TREE|nr:hypothetical protein LOC62_03G004289 [Vanrija pseudolonga]